MLQFSAAAVGDVGRICRSVSRIGEQAPKICSIAPSCVSNPSVERIHHVVATLAVAIGLGAVALAHPVVLPVLEAESGLVDANLAKALGVAVLERIDNVLLVAAALAAVTVRRASGQRLGTTFALLAIIVVAIDRFWLLPELAQAWSRVDLTVGRPHDRLEAAVAIEQYSLAASGALAALFGALTWMVVTTRSSTLPRS